MKIARKAVQSLSQLPKKFTMLSERFCDGRATILIVKAFEIRLRA